MELLCGRRFGEPGVRIDKASPKLVRHGFALCRRLQFCHSSIQPARFGVYLGGMKHRRNELALAGEWRATGGLLRLWNLLREAKAFGLYPPPPPPPPPHAHVMLTATSFLASVH